MLTLNERIKIVKEMHKYVSDVVGYDDLYYDVWCANAVPDGADETDFENIAEDLDLWRLAVRVFCEVVSTGEERERNGY